MEDVLKMHDRECNFYECFNNVPHFPKPKIYHLEKAKDGSPGIIIMEDLVNYAKVTGIYTSLTKEQVKKVFTSVKKYFKAFVIVENLAKFHAYQLENKEIWKNKFDDCVFFQIFDANFSKAMLKKLVELRPGFNFEFLKKFF